MYAPLLASRNPYAPNRHKYQFDRTGQMVKCRAQQAGSRWDGGAMKCGRLQTGRASAGQAASGRGKPAGQAASGRGQVGGAGRDGTERGRIGVLG